MSCWRISSSSHWAFPESIVRLLVLAGVNGEKSSQAPSRSLIVISCKFHVHAPNTSDCSGLESWYSTWLSYFSTNTKWGLIINHLSMSTLIPYVGTLKKICQGAWNPFHAHHFLQVKLLSERVTQLHHFSGTMHTVLLYSECHVCSHPSIQLVWGKN